MAVRFDAAADRLLITSGVYNFDTPYTWCGWIYVTTMPGAGAYSNIFSINLNGGASEDGFYVIGLTGVNKRIGIGVNNGSYEETVGTTDISAATWYFVALVRTGVTQLLGYLGTLTTTLALDVTETHTTVIGRAAPSRQEVGGAYSTNIDVLDGRVHGIKFFDRALTLAELAQEQFSIQPVGAPAWGWWPTFPGATERARDYSGNGRNFTESGTLADEQEPPISWGAEPWLVIKEAVGGAAEERLTEPLLLLPPRPSPALRW